MILSELPISFFVLLLFTYIAKGLDYPLRKIMEVENKIKNKNKKFFRPTDPPQKVLCNPNHVYFFVWP